MTAPPAGALEACLALLEKATAERWVASGEDRVVNETLMFCGDVSPVTDGRYRGDIASIQSCNHIGPHGISREEAAANADLIVAAVNLLKDHGPALLAALRLREAWIPVSERLPEREGLGQVLAFDADRPGKGVWLETTHPSWWGQFLPDSNEWAPSITHWMPLPAPPTADDLASVLEEG